MYEIERELGRGGMAAVFLATELELNRKVAIKVLPPELTFGSGMIARFQREARTAAQLDHPNIIPIYRVGTAGRLFYFAMKYVEGRSLADILQERATLPIPTVTGILDAVASALAYAHDRGVIHRDIKPANILIDRQGVVLVSDFGIARASQDATITETGAVVGTPQYMSPEQCSGQRVSPASDQYSLGIVGFQMLAGHVPFDADSAVPLLQMQILDPPPQLAPLRPEAPAELITIVEQSMQKASEDRFPHMSEFAEAVELLSINEQHAPEGRAQLRALAVGDTVAGLKVMTPISGPARVRQKPRLRRVVLAPLALVVVSVIAVLQWSTSPRAIPDNELDSASILAATPVEGTQTTPTAEPYDSAASDTTATEQVSEPDTQATPPPIPPRPRPAVVLFANLPSEAVALIDGDSVRGGRANLQPGTYTIVTQAPGFRPDSQQITVRAGERLQFIPALIPIPQDPGRLSVGSIPPGVLFIDGDRVGELPKRDLPVPAGERYIRIEAPGYEVYDTTITIEVGVLVNLRLIRLRARGH